MKATPEPIPTNAQACNVVGSTDDSSIDRGGWLGHWRTITRTHTRPVLCGNARCKSVAEVGGHVWLRGQQDALHCYILPLCNGCNSNTALDHPAGWRGRQQQDSEAHWFPVRAGNTLGLMRIRSHVCYSLPMNLS